MTTFNARRFFRRTTFRVLLGVLTLLLLPQEHVWGAADTFDVNGEQYRDIEQDLIANIIGSVPGEHYDAVSGAMRYIATDFYLPGNGDLPIFIERTLDSAQGGDHEFGHMKMLYNKIEMEGQLFYPWRSTITCHRETNNCHMYSQDTAVTHVLNACSALRHTYSYIDWTSGISNTIDYVGVLFPAPKFYVGDGKYVKFYFKTPADTRFPANATLVSPDNWFIDCVDSATMNVHSPDGVVYEIKRQILTGSYFDTQTWATTNYGPEDNYYTNRITDKSGNTITFEYDKPLLPTVQLSPSSNSAWDDYGRPRLTRIVASVRTGTVAVLPQLDTPLQTR